MTRSYCLYNQSACSPLFISTKYWIPLIQLFLWWCGFTFVSVRCGNIFTALVNDSNTCGSGWVHIKCGITWSRPDTHQHLQQFTDTQWYIWQPCALFTNADMEQTCWTQCLFLPSRPSQSIRKHVFLPPSSPLLPYAFSLLAHPSAKNLSLYSSQCSVIACCLHWLLCSLSFTLQGIQLLKSLTIFSPPALAHTSTILFYWFTVTCN